MHKLITLSIGKAYNFSANSLTNYQINSRTIEQTSCKLITGLKIRNLCVFKRSFTLEKIPLTQVLPQLLDADLPLLLQPIFEDKDQANSLCNLLIRNLLL